MEQKELYLRGERYYGDAVKNPETGEYVNPKTGELIEVREAE